MTTRIGVAFSIERCSNLMASRSIGFGATMRGTLGPGIVNRG